MLIKGDIAVDDRGKLSFVNDFDFKNVKRFYMVENHSKGFIRAWHGHKNENKYVYVVSGAILLAIVPMEGTKTMMFYDKCVLSADKPGIFCIPKGFYNGFKTLTDDAKVIFYSSSTLEESKEDDYRESSKKWNELFEVEER